jgi:hypothetical protein
VVFPTWYWRRKIWTKVIDGYNSLEIDEGIAVWPERILFAEQYELAGMSDLIIDIDDVYFDVLDHKPIEYLIL